MHLDAHARSHDAHAYASTIVCSDLMPPPRSTRVSFMPPRYAALRYMLLFLHLLGFFFLWFLIDISSFSCLRPLRYSIEYYRDVFLLLFFTCTLLPVYTTYFFLSSPLLRILRRMVDSLFGSGLGCAALDFTERTDLYGLWTASLVDLDQGSESRRESQPGFSMYTMLKDDRILHNTRITRTTGWTDH